MPYTKHQHGGAAVAEDEPDPSDPPHPPDLPPDTDPPPPPEPQGRDRKHLRERVNNSWRA